MAYTPDPSTADSPLTEEEISELLRAGGRELAKPKQVEHFLQRVAATMRMHTDERRMLNRQITLIETRKSYEGGAPTTLRPADAAKYMSPQEKAALCEATTREFLEALARKTEELEATRRRVHQALAAARMLAEEAATTSLPPELEGRLRALIGALANERTTPAALDAQISQARELHASGARSAPPTSPPAAPVVPPSPFAAPATAPVRPASVTPPPAPGPLGPPSAQPAATPASPDPWAQIVSPNPPGASS